MRNKLLGVLILVLCLYCASAMANEARDITLECVLTQQDFQTNAKYLKDRKYDTVGIGSHLKNSAVTIELPAGERCGGLYIVWADDVMPWVVQREGEGGAWETIFQDSNRFLHAYVPLDNVGARLRIVPGDGGERYLRIKELYILGEGDTPAWVQRWLPAPDKVDLLVLSAHPDDEWIYMGGTIPTYVDRGKTVMVAYLTTANTLRRTELLNGLWLGGVRYYPNITSALPDRMKMTLAEQYGYWNKNGVYDLVSYFYRRYQPEVVVTHDINGEYGHGAHRVAADAARKAVAFAADPDYERLRYLAPWQIDKLYLHLYEENPVVMDWRVPLDSFGGLTALEIAMEAYLMHVSQHDGNWVVTDEGRCSNSRFGLYFSVPGAVVREDDFF